MVTDITQDEARNSSHERIERTAARFKEGTSSVVGGAKEKLDAAADHVESGLHRATDASARGAKRAAEKAGQLRDRGDEALETVRDFVREKPVQSVAIALAAGWLIGRLLNRRH
ncbi:MAG TPA: hypothetical protein VFJ87_09135 [Rhodanobacteraceae bacterium]|jgi:ElaB/YqjD/DUF883 family membrane-anchored ribosome-binding protein|nr:hypothetical protein [Rhodanobacteraceae bacterium]